MSQADAPAVARVFPGELRGVREARRWAAAVLAQAGADPETGELLASELVTNAVLHTRSGWPGGTVTVLVTAGGVLHVHDHGPASGSCAPGDWVPGAGRADFGRGLVIAAELGAGLVHGPAAACPAAGPGDLAAGAGGCCTRCVPPALEAALPGAAPLKGQPPAAAAA
jgi:anti-sigma regulatory factor (Ser/Thr protein kinase)